MNRVIRAKSLVVTLTMACLWLFAFVSHDAQAFYNPSTGHWLSRDPIEEEGGMGLYGFVQNDPMAQFDPQGLSIWSRNLIFSSQGEAQRDPELFSIWFSWDSGIQASPNAWTAQTVIGLGNAGGICNSGTRFPGHIGTFAQGWVSLRCASPAMVTIKCTTVYVVVAVANAAVTIDAALGGVSLDSSMLGDVLPQHRKFTRNGVMALTATETRTKTLFLNPFRRQEIYNINPWIGGMKGIAGAFFIESLNVNCEEVDED